VTCPNEYFDYSKSTYICEPFNNTNKNENAHLLNGVVRKHNTVQDKASKRYGRWKSGIKQGVANNANVVKTTVM
jgi:hypothetical protein